MLSVANEIAPSVNARLGKTAFAADHTKEHWPQMNADQILAFHAGSCCFVRSVVPALKSKP